MEMDKGIFVTEKEKQLEHACRDHGLSLTIQRRAVLENLAGRNDHPTAEDIYESVKDRLKGLSRTTVYRVLETLVSVGIVRRISNPESKARFDADTSRHHHLTCISCGTVLDIRDEKLNALPLPEHISKDLELIDYSINFTGRCPRCKNK